MEAQYIGIDACVHAGLSTPYLSTWTSTYLPLPVQLPTLYFTIQTQLYHYKYAYYPNAIYS